jgi:NADP-dependent aldehyde dehydrogenase
MEPNTSAGDVERVLASADSASRIWADTSAADRAEALVAVADALDEAADRLIPVAVAETHLAEARLRGELVRTTFQLRFLGDYIRDGAYLDARIDHADPAWPMGAPRPDLRRMLRPLGPVLVYAASNFPFAFSVAGGDTAAGLAAGVAVIVKTHPDHPALSALTGDVVTRALAAAGAPDGLFHTIEGREPGLIALRDPRVKAASFTGSIPGGRALFDIAQSRPDPIPFYGELGSVNPVFVTEAAAAERGTEIAAQFVGSFTMGAGQFCTKPGVLLVPRTSSIGGALGAAELPAGVPMLSDRITSAYLHELDTVAGLESVSVINGTIDPDASSPAPVLVRTDVASVLADPDRFIVEVFGPSALVVEYDDEAELVSVARALAGQLTATVVGNDDDTIAPELLGVLAEKAGRVLWNQWPTGVSVTHAQTHGGPYPSSTSVRETSVGSASVHRFVRPVSFQGVPASLLPLELRDDNPLGIPQLVDGVAVGASVPA